MIVASRTEPLPSGTERRMADFTELVAVAIANAEARAELRRMVEEQSALRRVATLVAQAGSPSVVFEAVTREVGLLCDADLARMERYEADGTVTGMATWSRVPVELTVGTRFTLDGPSIARGVKETQGQFGWTASGTTWGRSPGRRGGWGSGPRWAARSWSGGGCGG
jgi:hypothetical protein